MIRPRRTFQERNVQSASRWDRLRSTNRVKGYFRVVGLFCVFGSILVFVITKFPAITPPSILAKHRLENQISSQSDFQYILGADEASEVRQRDTSSEWNQVLSTNQEPEEEVSENDETDESDNDNPEQNSHGNSDEEDNVNEENGDSPLGDHDVKVAVKPRLESRESQSPDNPAKEVSTESERSEDDSESEQSEVEEDVKAEAKISIDGTVGNAEIGGTFDGNILTIYPQITLPDLPIIQHYDSTQNYWPLHAILKERGWAYATMALPSRVTMWISRGSVPPRLKQGYQMLNSMGVSGCVGGAKSLQLECRRRLARLNGCEYDTLKIQPAQYNMLNLDDCRRFFTDAERPDRANKVYLSKPTFTFHGSGIRIHQGAGGSLKSEFGSCKTPKNTILMDYVSNPATMMGGYKFDFRTYLLVASLKPQLVFYHDGFVRKSDRTFDLHSKDLNVHITNKVTQSKEDHFFNFTTLGVELNRELGLPLDHLDKYVRPRAKDVSRFLFQTTLVQPQPPRHVPGRFHLFGIDWLLDADGNLHLLEGNGYPLVTHYQGIDLTPRIWEEMVDLILAIQTKPQSLPQKMTVKDGYAFGGWKLVYNELEETMEQAKGNAYSSCKVFAGSP